MHKKPAVLPENSKKKFSDPHP